MITDIDASKIITRLITLGTSLASAISQTILNLGEVAQFSGETEVECEKGDFLGRKSQISLKWCDIEQKLQQNVDINSYISYRLVTYSMTSHDL